MTKGNDDIKFWLPADPGAQRFFDRLERRGFIAKTGDEHLAPDSCLRSAYFGLVPLERIQAAFDAWDRKGWMALVPACVH